MKIGCFLWHLIDQRIPIYVCVISVDAVGSWLSNRGTTAGQFCIEAIIMIIHTYITTDHNCCRCRKTFFEVTVKPCMFTHKRNDEAGYLNVCVGRGPFRLCCLALHPSVPILTDWGRAKPSLLFSLQWGVGSVWKGGQLTSVPACLSSCFATGGRDYIGLHGLV